MYDFILEEFAGFVARGTDAHGKIRAPSSRLIPPMLRPTQCDEVETQCLGDGRIIFQSRSIGGRKAIERQPGSEG